jgi:hypothetical protein
MNYENYVVHINVQQKDIDLKHPLNTFGNFKSSGTGFYIDKGIILTCYHVVQNSLEIIVSAKNINNDYIKINAKIIYIFPDDDLAVIELENKDITYNIFDYFIVTTSEINKDVNTIGFPLDSTSLKVNRGVISGFQDSNIQTDSTLNPGNSGGPLVMNNKVIGINQSRMTGEASNTGYAIPIFRFLILYKLKKDKLKLINNKPKFLFKYQTNLQKFYNFDYGVRISQINNESILKNIYVDDLLLEINKNKIDSYGKVKFDFFPEKIILNDLSLWFTEDDELLFTIYSKKENKIITKLIKLKYIETNLINYYSESNIKYNFENKGLVFSVFTDYHIESMKELGINLISKVKLLSRFLSINDKFTIYLSDLIYSKLKFTNYPINEIITHINEIEITSYDKLVNVMKDEIKNFRTIDNDFYLV